MLQLKLVVDQHAQTKHFEIFRGRKITFGMLCLFLLIIVDIVQGNWPLIFPADLY